MWHWSPSLAMSILVTFLWRKICRWLVTFLSPTSRSRHYYRNQFRISGSVVEVPKVTFMKTREWSSSLAFNLEIQWLSDYFCIKNSILFKYLFIKRFTSSKNESIFNQFMFLSANMLKSEHLAKKHSRNILMILINGSNMIKARKTLL